MYCKNWKLAVAHPQRDGVGGRKALILRYSKVEKGLTENQSYVAFSITLLDPLQVRYSVLGATGP